MPARQRRALLTLAAVALASALAGCGSSSATSPATQARLVREINAVCVERSARGLAPGQKDPTRARLATLTIKLEHAASNTAAGKALTRAKSERQMLLAAAIKQARGGRVHISPAVEGRLGSLAQEILASKRALGITACPR